MKPRAPKGRLCPFWRKDMALVCHKCPLWTHLRGKNPQSEQEIDEWGCALAWLPLLLVEGAQQTRQAGAAIESFRNEMMRLAQDGDQASGVRNVSPVIDAPYRRLSSDA
jgi:hypothetical protein